MDGSGLDSNLCFLWLIAFWLEEVNLPQTEAELGPIHRCVQRGQPYWRESWVRKVVGRLGLESTPRPRGQPRKPVGLLEKQRRGPNKGS